MAVLKYKDGDGNYQEIVGINVQNEVVQTTGQSTAAVMSQKAVTDYVQSVLVNPISDSSILVNTEFSPRDVISVDGEMYMADAETSDLPKTNPVVQDNKVVTQDGKVVLGFSSTTSADWHSF